MKRIFFILILISSLARADSSPVDFLKKLVEIDSGTSQVENVNSVQTLLKARLEALGFAVALKANPLGETKSGKLLIATLQGENPEWITFLGHADTVFEKSAQFSGLRVDQGIARGPGVIDDKGGLVVALTGLSQYLATHQRPYYSLRFIISPSEETGSEGFIDDFKSLAQNTQLVLGFEPSLDDGSIVESRRGNRWYLIQITGREAHAGRDHKKGINACLDLSSKIAKISSFTDYKKDVTVSIGHMEGGQDKYNVVCGYAQAKIDTRFSDTSERDRLQKKIDVVFQSEPVRSALDHEPATIKVLIANDCPPFSATADAKKYIAEYQNAILSVEKTKPSSLKSGGSADSNQFTRPGIAIIDGLGPTGGGMHTRDEHLVVSSLQSRADALAIFLDKLRQIR